MKNKGKKIADEVWIMLPDSCKEIMKGIKKTFKDSIEADVNDLFIVKSNKKCECKQAKEMEKQQQGYSEEEVIAFGEFIFKNTLLVNVKGVEGILEQFKNK